MSAPFPDELTVRGWDRFRAAQLHNRPPKRCQCGDVGWFVKDCTDEHPFCTLVRCPLCNREE